MGYYIMGNREFKEVPKQKKGQCTNYLVHQPYLLNAAPGYNYPPI